MNYGSWLFFSILVLGFIYEAYACFKAINHYDGNKGFQSNTVCYIKSPYSSGIHNKITSPFLSEWVMKGIVLVILIMAISIAIYFNQPLLGILLLLMCYLALLIWYRLYSEASGVKLLEVGVAKGVRIIVWEDIKKIDFTKKKKNTGKEHASLVLKLEKKFLPITIEITNANEAFLEKYLSERCPS